MDEKRANLCRVAKRVQKRVLTARPMVAPIKRLALAPAAATDDRQSCLRVHCLATLRSAGFGLRHDICSVGDKLAIDAKNGFERSFDLRLRVIPSLQSAHGRFDQFT